MSQPYLPGKICQILNLGIQPPGNHCRRVWMQPGVPMIIGPQLTLSVYFDCGEERYMPRAVLKTPKSAREFDLPEACWLDMSAWCGLLALPRAVEFSALPPYARYTRPMRLLMEFSDVHAAIQEGVL